MVQGWQIVPGDWLHSSHHLDRPGAPAQHERKAAEPAPPSSLASTSTPADIVTMAPLSALTRSLGVMAHSTAAYAPA